MKKIDPKKLLQNLVKIVLSVAAFYLIFSKVDEKQALSYLKEVNLWYMAGAALAFYLSKVVIFFRINRFYRAKGMYLSDAVNFRLSWSALFYNLIIPIVGSEGYKVVWLKRNKAFDVKWLSIAALLDRATGVVAIFALIAILFLGSSYDPEMKELAWLVVPAVYLSQYTVMKYAFPGYISALPVNAGLSIATQILQAVTVWLIILALGVPDHHVEYLFVFMLSTLAHMLPFAGAREAAFVFGADYLGLDKDLSLTIGILFYLCQVITALGGLYYIFQPGKIDPEGGEITEASETSNQSTL